MQVLVEEPVNHSSISILKCDMDRIGYYFRVVPYAIVRRVQLQPFGYHSNRIIGLVYIEKGLVSSFGSHKVDYTYQDA